MKLLVGMTAACQSLFQETSFYQEDEPRQGDAGMKLSVGMTAACQSLFQETSFYQEDELAGDANSDLRGF
jgi:hypothetical protein